MKLVSTRQMFIANFFQIRESGERLRRLPGNVQPEFDQSRVTIFGRRFLTCSFFGFCFSSRFAFHDRSSPTPDRRTWISPLEVPTYPTYLAPCAVVSSTARIHRGRIQRRCLTARGVTLRFEPRWPCVAVRERGTSLGRLAAG